MKGEKGETRTRKGHQLTPIVGRTIGAVFLAGPASTRLLFASRFDRPDTRATTLKFHREIGGVDAINGTPRGILVPVKRIHQHFDRLLLIQLFSRDIETKLSCLYPETNRTCKILKEHFSPDDHSESLG